jgi:hypothetical protein
MVIFEETFAPPKIARTGFSLSSYTFFILIISVSNKSPKHLFSLKNGATIVV